MADAHAKPHHDYHLVDPSPWPAVGSVSVFILAVGAISWMHHMYPAAPLVFGVGVIGVLYTFVAWWRDVIREATFEGLHTPVVQIGLRYGMALFIASGYWRVRSEKSFTSVTTMLTVTLSPGLLALGAPRDRLA